MKLKRNVVIGSAAVAVIGLGSVIYLSLADTYPAASASRADVAAAVALASSGDTVTIPAGAANWTSPITLPDGVKIVGAGMWQTILTNAAGAGIFILNDFTWVEGITMIANGGNTSSTFHSIAGTNIVIKDVWFDCAINWNGSALLAIRDTQHNIIPNGVMENCVFVDTRCLFESPYFNGMHTRWAQPTRFGYQDTWYIQNSKFTNVNWGQNVIDANYGGSYVIRSNTFHNCAPSSHGIQSFNSRGPRKTEVYENLFTGGAQPNTMSVGAGTSLFWNNTCSDTVTWTGNKAKLWLSLARAYGSVGTGGKADGHSNWDGNRTNGIARATGTHTGSDGASVLTDSAQAWTGNQFVVSGWSRWIYNLTDGSKGQCTANSATTFTATLSGGAANVWNTGDEYLITDGWPARDQPGTGQDASAWTGFYTNAAPLQASEPIYIWGNTNFAASIVYLNDQGQPQSAQLMQEGRDWILDELPGYTPMGGHPLLGDSGIPDPPPPAGGGPAGNRRPGLRGLKKL